MNPLTNMKNVSKLSERELQSESKSSWHDQYKDSAWLFIGGLPYDLTEGDIICIFSQYGEIVNINLIRDKDTGKSKGFCFLCYEDQRSTILAVDNLNGIKVLNRFMRVDHVQKYKVPKEGKKTDDETKKLYSEGCAPKLEPLVPKIATPVENSRPTLADQIEPEIKLPQRLPIYNVKKEELSDKIKEENHEKEDIRSVKEKKILKHKKSRHSERDLSSSEKEPPKKKKSKRSHSEKDQIDGKKPRKDAKIFKTKKKF